MSCLAQEPVMIYHEQTATSIYLHWNKPTSQNMLDDVEIKYRKENEEIFTTFTHRTRDNNITLYNLTSGVVYFIKGYIVKDDGKIQQMFKTVCRTNPSPLIEIIQESTLIHTWNKLHIYKLPCIVHESDILKQCHILSKQPYDAKEKSILIVGPYASGKSSFINAMMNYKADVSFGDVFRFEMIDQTKFDRRHTGQKDFSPPTTSTTCYRIPLREEFNIDFPLNIIDTPGFGNIFDQSDDENILFQIKHVLESVVHRIHSVCIVIPFYLTRITELHQRAFNSILQILGLFDVNIKTIFHLCLTHDDGGDLKPCLSAMTKTGIPFEKYFRFNNSPLFQMNMCKQVWRYENVI